MLLRRIALERFRQLDQQEYTFQPGLNLIKGPNEAGKTTLQDAILFALLGNPRHATLERVKHVDDHISWGRNRAFSITLEFADEGGAAYRLRKDWDTQSVCLTNLQTGDKEEDNDSVQRVISEILGHGSLKLLQSTACVEQDAISEISTGRREIGDQLQSIVTGGGAGEAAVSAVIKDLGDKIAEMARGWRTAAPRNPGPIKVKRDEIGRLERQLSEVHPQVEQVEEAKEQLIALEAQTDEIKRKLASRQSLKDLYDQYFEWEDKRETQQDREEELEAKIEQIEQAQQELNEGTQPTEGRARLRFPTIPLVGAGVGCLLLLIGILISVLGLLVIGIPVGLLGLLIGVGCLIWLLIVLSRSRSVDLGPRIAAQARRDALLGDQTLETLIEERKAVSGHRRDAEEALEAPEMRRAAEMSPLQYEELKQDTERLAEDLDEKKQEQIKYRTRRDDATYTIEDIHRLEERKAAAERDLARLEERLSTYKLTYEVMEEAKEQTMRSARNELEPKIGAYFSRITQKRYDKVEADDDLNLRVFSQEKGDWATPDGGELSRGTVDQLYLAARLALLDLIYRDAKPPLLLDDPFVKFDPDRRRQAVALCKEIAREHQVLLFTCSDDYDLFADNMIELPKQYV